MKIQIKSRRCPYYRNCKYYRMLSPVCSIQGGFLNANKKCRIYQKKEAKEFKEFKKNR